MKRSQNIKTGTTACAVFTDRFKQESGGHISLAQPVVVSRHGEKGGEERGEERGNLGLNMPRSPLCV